MHIESIGILGYGQFGKFIHQLAKQHLPEIEVLISSHNDPQSVSLEEVCKADIIFPCAPIQYIEEQIESIIPHLGGNSIIREICTVKVHPQETLTRYKNITYISSHPMFGPESYVKKGNKLRGLTLARCGDTLKPETHKLFVRTLEKMGLNIIFHTPNDHDRILAETLFLTHYVSQIIYQAKFHRSDIDTVSFGFLMDAVESVKDNEALFQDVRKFNPYCQEVVERFATTNNTILQGLGSKKSM